MSQAALRVTVYVDGFNLYYGALKGTPYRWLDIGALCSKLLPAYSIHRIRYFTAIVKPRPDNPDQAQRQLTYIRALQAATPNLTVHRGEFLQTQVRARLVNPPPNTHLVYKTEEKGSDVNIASYILVDAFDNDYDVAVIVSNDSDLATPIRLTRSRFGKTVIVLNPHPKPSVTLQQVASQVRPIRAGVLRVSQLPPTLTDAQGTITKPVSW